MNNFALLDIELGRDRQSFVLFCLLVGDKVWNMDRGTCKEDGPRAYCALRAYSAEQIFFLFFIFFYFFYITTT